MGALRAARAAGRVRFVGASVYTAAEGRAAIETGRADVVMITHSLLNHGESDELLAVAAAAGCAVMARSVLANGLLTGKYDARSTFAADDHRSHRGADWLASSAARVDAIRPIAERIGMRSPRPGAGLRALRRRARQRRHRRPHAGPAGRQPRRRPARPAGARWLRPISRTSTRQPVMSDLPDQAIDPSSRLPLYAQLEQILEQQLIGRAQGRRHAADRGAAVRAVRRLAAGRPTGDQRVRRPRPAVPVARQGHVRLGRAPGRAAAAADARLLRRPRGGGARGVSTTWSGSRSWQPTRGWPSRSRWRPGGAAVRIERLRRIDGEVVASCARSSRSRCTRS